MLLNSADFNIADVTFNFNNFIRNTNRINGEGSTARKNCSTPKSRLLDTVRADV